MTLCEQCVDSMGRKCHTPGCPAAAPARWKCSICGPLHGYQLLYESHSQIPYCRRCGNDAEAA